MWPFRYKYTQMFPGDVPLWERFLRLQGKEFRKFEYDVKVGRGIEAPPDWAEQYRKATRILSLKRIDVVGYKDNQVWIFEVKPDAGLSALGQLIGYRTLWLRERKEPPYVILALITDRLNEDERYLFEQHGIKLFLV